MDPAVQSTCVCQLGPEHSVHKLLSGHKATTCPLSEHDMVNSGSLLASLLSLGNGPPNICVCRGHSLSFGSQKTECCGVRLWGNTRFLQVSQSGLRCSGSESLHTPPRVQAVAS